MSTGNHPGPEVTIIDSFARDGLQTLVHLPDLRHPTTAEKIEIITALDKAGLPEIEITGFVHPRVIPSLADAEAVADGVLSSGVEAVTRALVPNLRGAERALSVGVEKLSALTVASETYQRLNANMSISENLDAIAQIVEVADREGAQVVMGIGTSFVCPYEGLVSESAVFEIVGQCVDLGITEVTLADSVGLSWPSLVTERFEAAAERWPTIDFGLHMHDLSGLGIANVYAAYQSGVRRFDGVVGGLGGGIAMPIPTTAMANVATEDLVYLFESSGVTTGIDPGAVSGIARRVKELIGAGSGHAGNFGTLTELIEMAQATLQRGETVPHRGSPNGDG